MEVKNNYKECLTNLACSIRKYFGLPTKNNTLEYIDKLLQDYNPKNVIVILFDGMGSRILDRTLDENAFFRKNKLKDITSVFPATTTAATTSMRTGLNPIEHGWLGWNTYIAPIDKTITLFLNVEKGKKDICEEFLKVKDKLVLTTIKHEINHNTEYESVELFPFGENKYNDLDDMINRILEESKKDGKKYIYAYDDEPDGTMHEIGNDKEKVIELIKERNLKVYELCEKLEDSVVIVVADHGHLNVEPIYIYDYPEICNLLERTTSLEQRAISFKIKEENKELFEELFEKHFGEYFKLYKKEEIKESNLFGYGKENELFDEAIGDYIAIAETSNKCLLSDGDELLKSQHAGYTDDEIYVPLIIKPTQKKLVKKIDKL